MRWDGWGHVRRHSSHKIRGLKSRNDGNKGVIEVVYLFTKMVFATGSANLGLCKVTNYLAGIHSTATLHEW